MTLSTHVLDAVTGRPAAGVSVRLERRALASNGAWNEAWTVMETGQTDADGRLRLPSMTSPGVYRVTFGSEEYFAARNVATFYPEVAVTFEVTSPAEHYHVPLLLSPFAYSTYRGS